MDASQILSGIVLPVVFIVVGIALAVFIVELIKTMKSARKMVDVTCEQLVPTLQHIEQITNDLQPAVAKVDPLVERVQLTVDAANLELMRVDQILEDVNDVTGTLSSASDAMNTIASGPAELVASVTQRVRGTVRGSRASAESARLAQQRDVEAVERAAEGAAEGEYFTYEPNEGDAAAAAKADAAAAEDEAAAAREAASPAHAVPSSDPDLA